MAHIYFHDFVMSISQVSHLPSQCEEQINKNQKIFQLWCCVCGEGCMRDSECYNHIYFLHLAREGSEIRCDRCYMIFTDVFSALSHFQYCHFTIEYHCNMCSFTTIFHTSAIRHSLNCHHESWLVRPQTAKTTNIIQKQISQIFK